MVVSRIKPPPRDQSQQHIAVFVLHDGGDKPDERWWCLIVEESPVIVREVPPVWSPSQAAAQREAKRRPLFYTYMNLWPFVGVTLVLLCIFMVNVPPLHDIGPNLPASSYAIRQPLALREDAMKISIIRDGRVFFRHTWVLPEELPGFIRDALHSGAEKKVYLAVDSRSKFADTALVVDEIGKAGIREICFFTEKAAIRQ